MMRCSLLVFSMIICFSCFAEDIIVLRSGDIIKAKLLEIGQTEIKYKKASNPEGPTYTRSKSDVLSINYENGDYDKFEPSEGLIKANLFVSNIPAADNDALIKSYSSSPIYFKDKKVNKKQAKSAILLYGVSENSVLSTEDLQISFQNGCHILDKWYPINSPMNKKFNAAGTELQIAIENKSDNPIYIDLEKTIINNDLLGYYQFFDNSTSLISGGSSSYAGIGIIGGSTSSGASVQNQQIRILRVNPHEKIVIPGKPMLVGDDIYMRYPFLSNVMVPLLNSDKFTDLTEYGCVNFSSKDSPVNINFTMPYSFSETFDDKSEMKVQLYVKQALGIPNFYDVWWDKKRGRIKELDGIDEKSIIGILTLEDIDPSSMKGKYIKIHQSSIHIYGGD